MTSGCWCELRCCIVVFVHSLEYCTEVRCALSTCHLFWGGEQHVSFWYLHNLTTDKCVTVSALDLDYSVARLCILVSVSYFRCFVCSWHCNSLSFDSSCFPSSLSTPPALYPLCNKKCLNTKLITRTNPTCTTAVHQHHRWTYGQLMIAILHASCGKKCHMKCCC